MQAGKQHWIVLHDAEHNPAENESKTGDELHVRLIGGHCWRRERDKQVVMTLQVGFIGGCVAGRAVIMTVLNL